LWDFSPTFDKPRKRLLFQAWQIAAYMTFNIREALKENHLTDGFREYGVTSFLKTCVCA